MVTFKSTPYRVGTVTAAVTIPKAYFDDGSLKLGQEYLVTIVEIKNEGDHEHTTQAKPED